jgi:hypothetical protein
VERVAQRRFVFAAPGPARATLAAAARRARRRRQAPAQGGVSPHDRIEPGERGAGEKGVTRRFVQNRTLSGQGLEGFSGTDVLAVEALAERLEVRRFIGVRLPLSENRRPSR